ncbi:hypothetical protein ACOSQ2_023418 [Xanthoceras sorbifolium]
MSSSISSPQAFDSSLLIPEGPSLDFQSLARTLNFNLPLKLNKINYVNWKAQSRSTATFFALINYLSKYSWSIILPFNATNSLTKIGMATQIKIPYSNLHSLKYS